MRNPASDLGIDIAIYDTSKLLPWGFPLLDDGIPLVIFVRHVFGTKLFYELPAPIAIPAIITERVIPAIYRSATVLTESEYAMQNLMRWGVQRDRIRVVRPGIDTKIFSPDASHRSRHPLVSYIGRLKRYKRVDLALRAMKLLSRTNPDLRMQIVGDGSDRARLQGLVKLLSLEGVVDFLGRVNESTLLEQYRRSWFTVQPSAVEGWGLTVIESAACGVPTVAFNTSVFPEVVGDVSAKYLAQDGDFVDLAAKLGACLRDVSDNAHDVSQRLVSYAKGFDWGVTAKEYLSILRQAVSSYPRRVSALHY